MARPFRLCASFAVALLVGLAPPVLAVPIVYTFTGTATGTVNGVAFTDAAFTITMQR